MLNDSWLSHFIKEAELIASKSKDPRTKVGAVIVGPELEIISKGYNGLPRGVADDWRLYAFNKNDYMVHAELNAILNCARLGVSPKGASIIVQFHPCTECSKAIIQSGISVVYTPKIQEGNPWSGSQLRGLNLMAEAGVIVANYTL
jgi:dCMP deaminase